MCYRHSTARLPYHTTLECNLPKLEPNKQALLWFPVPLCVCHIIPRTNPAPLKRGRGGRAAPPTVQRSTWGQCSGGDPDFLSLKVYTDQHMETPHAQVYTAYRGCAVMVSPASGPSPAGEGIGAPCWCRLLWEGELSSTLSPGQGWDCPPVLSKKFRSGKVLLPAAAVRHRCRWL